MERPPRSMADRWTTAQLLPIVRLLLFILVLCGFNLSVASRAATTSHAATAASAITGRGGSAAARLWNSNMKCEAALEAVCARPPPSQPWSARPQPPPLVPTTAKRVCPSSASARTTSTSAARRAGSPEARGALPGVEPATSRGGVAQHKKNTKIQLPPKSPPRPRRPLRVVAAPSRPDDMPGRPPGRLPTPSALCNAQCDRNLLPSHPAERGAVSACGSLGCPSSMHARAIEHCH